MISLNTSRVAVAATALISLSAVSFAQKTFSFPHVLEQDGRIVAIAWDLSGGQLEFVLEKDASGATVVRRQHSPIGALYSLYGNDELYQNVASALAGKPPARDLTPLVYQVWRKISTSANLATQPFVNEVVFPGGDVDSKNPAGVEIYFNPKEYRFERSKDGAEVKGGFDAAKKQKMWTPSNFRLTIGDLPCSRVRKTTRVRATEVQAVFAEIRSFQFTLPLEDAKAFLAPLRDTIAGTPKELPLRMEYLDEDGTVLMALTMMVYVSSVDKEDPLDPYDPSDPVNKEKPATVKVTYNGQVTLDKAVA